MSKRVLLGKIDSNDYGLLVSRAGVDVTTANADQLLFDSRSNGYAQSIFKETITMTRQPISGGSSNDQTRTFSSVDIPNPIIIIYGDVFVNVTKTSKTVTFRVPYYYPGFRTSHPLSVFGVGVTGKVTPASQSVTYAVIRGPA
jgi:hypothetical protein|tara:strand:+ start:390 stop:818 length:429 start_codon:yes stop_codon:yes gene_type:complete